MPPLVPDCTLTTACFCVHGANPHAFDAAQIAENAAALMQSAVYLVVYCDAEMRGVLEPLRAPYAHLTEFRVVDRRALWAYQYEDRVNANRAAFWGTRDARAGTDSHLITCSKPDLVLQTMARDPFGTSKFGWVDCFLRKNMAKVAEDWTPNLLPLALEAVRGDKFHIQILNVADKKYKQPEHKREMYGQYRYVVCGCLFAGGRGVAGRVLTRLKEVFVETTEAGFGHGEEMLFLEVLDEFYGDICRSYGDYGQILNNFAAPRRNLPYVVHHILDRYVALGYHREGCDLGGVLLDEIRHHRVAVPADLHRHVALQLYVCAFYHAPERAKEVAQYMVAAYRALPDFRAEFDKNRDFYVKQLAFTLPQVADELG